MSVFGCNGSTIKTRSGKYIDLINPSVDDIDLESIAHALSNICRYGGHVDFYSVAEHSYHCCYAARNIGGCSAEEAKAILMHDATEAFLGDCVKPLKICLPDYQAVEAKMEKVIGERFGIDFEKHHTIIKYWDKVLLKEEKKFFWPNDTEEWTGFSEIPDYDLKNIFRLYQPDLSKSLFLGYARMLGVK